MTNQTQIGIHIKSTADTSGLDKAERATDQLAAETRQLEQAFENTAQGARELERAAEQIGEEMRGAGNETEKAAKEFWEFQRGTEAASKEVLELSQRTEAHADRLREVMRVQKEMGNTPDPFQAEGIVRAYEREQYELEKRRAVSKEDWMERQNYLKQEREERDKVRDATIKQAQAERELKNAESWETRRANMKEEQEERNKLRQATIQQGIEERKAARESEQAWARRKEMVQDFALAAITAVGAFAKESYTAFAAFDDSIRQIATIAPEWQGDIKGLTAETRALSREWGIMPEIMAATVQAAQGLGSTDILEDAELVSMAAIAGRADAAATMEAVLKTQNAFEDGLYETEGVLDIFFKTIDLGAVKMDDLASGISEVTSVAGETNTPLQDIAAALVTMTRQGDSFNEAVELSGLLLMQLGTEGSAAATAFTEATGKSYRQFIADGGSLGEAMQALQEHAQATGQEIGAMLSGNSPFFRDSQAARAAMELSGVHLDRLIDTTEEMYDVAGTMSDAYAIMADSSQRDIDRMTVAWENVKLSAGEYVASLEWVENTMNNVAQAAEFMSGGTGYDLGQVVEQNQAATNSVEDLTAELGRLREAKEQANGWNEFEIPIQARQDEINTILVETGLEAARTAETLGEIKEALDGAFGEGATEITRNAAGLTEVMVQMGSETVNLGAASHILMGNLLAVEEAVMLQNAAMAGSFDNFQENRTAAENYTVVMGDLNAELGMIAQNSARAAAAMRDTAEVSKVLDGDTLRVDGMADFRLLGVNTPETAKDWLGEAGMPFGDEAMRFTQEFLVNPEISFEASGTDPHGRMLASVFNGEGASLEHELVAAGLALPMPVHMVGDEQLVADLTALAREAAEAGEGIFGDERVATAYLEGRIEDMEQVATMYAVLEAEDEAYYANLAQLEEQWRSASIAAYGQSKDMVDALIEARQGLADLGGDGLGEVYGADARAAEEARVSIEAANQAIIDSYRTTAFEALLAQTGVTESTLALGVSLGIMTQEKAEARLEFTNTTVALTELASAESFVEMSTRDQSDATQLLILGYADTAEEAAIMAEAISGPLSNSLLRATELTDELKASLDEATGPDGQPKMTAAYAESTIVLDDYAIGMGELEAVMDDTVTTATRLNERFVETAAQGINAAIVLDGEVTNGFYTAANGAAVLEAAALRAGNELKELPKEVSISIVSDTSRFTVPSLPANSNQPEIQAYGRGGRVEGGIAGRDSVPALLMPGEYVVSASAAQSMGYDVLDQINQGSSSAGSVGGGEGGGGGAITVNMPVTFHFAGGATPDIKVAIMEVMEQQQRELQTALLRVGRKS
jgi:TP901 family phage tail tape measure protein